MSIRTRLWASLIAALAMVLAGLATAGPAVADPGAAKYENVTATESALAVCDLDASANKPTKSGGRVRGSGNISVTGCSTSWEVLLHLKVYVRGEWLPVTTLRQTVYAPYSAYFSTSTACREGRWLTEIIIQRGAEDAAARSTQLVVEDC
jgi:hypothetical protein